VRNEQNDPACRSYCLKPQLSASARIDALDTVRIGEDQDGIGEVDTMLGEIAGCLGRIPFEIHNACL
jgi:hypothetical protein